MKRFLTLICTLVFALVCLTAALPFAAAEEAPAAEETSEEGTENHTIEWKTVPLIFGSAGEPAGDDSCPLYFVDGAEDLPYIGIAVLRDLLTMAMKLEEPLDLNYADGVLRINRTDVTDAGTVTVDYVNSSITFYDYDAFVTMPYQKAVLDIVSNTYMDGVEAYIFRGGNTFDFERRGRSLTVSAGADYGIMFYPTEDDAYMPLQTFMDVFMTAGSFMTAMYNGKYLFINPVFSDSEGGDTPAYLTFMDDTAGIPRSEALKRFNYWELCLALDLLYGLKEEHRITTFNDLFTETGLDALFFDDDPTMATAALYRLAYGYLADVHTSVYSPSFRVDWDRLAQQEKINVSPASEKQNEELQRYRKARSAFRSDDSSMYYEESGDTAFISLDGFRNAHRDYYKEPDLVEKLEDTTAFVICCNRRIKRENSPIKNVVLDLSCNSGGELDAAIYVLGWFLGPTVLNTCNSMTGAQTSCRYYVDVDLDRNSNDADTLKGYNRYCLISPASFSCGNLVPSVFKSSADVTLLGKTSGGGGCYVINLTTANGDIIRISSPLEMMTMKNGSYYQVDRGVEPDFWIDRIENFYNRDALAERIRNLDK